MAAKKRARRVTPTTRALEECKRRKWFAGIVERHIRVHSFDLFGCIDVVAVQPGTLGVLGIQVTSTPNMSARRKKILCELKPHHTEAVKAFISCGNRVEVWGYAKRGARGQEKKWTLRVDEISLADFEETSYGVSDEVQE